MPSSPPAESPSDPPAEMPPRKDSSPWRVTFILMLILVLPPALALAAIVMPGPLEENKTIVIPHGTGIRDIASLLEKNGIITNPLFFRIASKGLAADALKAGEYAFTPQQSIADIVLMMREGHSVIRQFTAAEGLTSSEIVDSLTNDPSLVGTIAKPPAEGSLLPETYNYSFGDTRASIIARMQKAMQDTLSDMWAQRDPNLPLKSPQEALTLASVIEKETGKPEERPRIAGVFYNRLAHTMRLQSDPTVIYALTQGRGSLDRALTRNDLNFPSPYNTYMSDGLPPGPICNPGRASLEAALHPEQNDYLYFVADGTGGHVFAKTLDEHNQNVVRWISEKKNPLPAPLKPAANNK